MFDRGLFKIGLASLAQIAFEIPINTVIVSQFNFELTAGTIEQPSGNMLNSIYSHVNMIAKYRYSVKINLLRSGVEHTIPVSW